MPLSHSPGRLCIGPFGAGPADRDAFTESGGIDAGSLTLSASPGLDAGPVLDLAETRRWAMPIVVTFRSSDPFAGMDACWLFLLFTGRRHPGARKVKAEYRRRARARVRRGLGRP